MKAKTNTRTVKDVPMWITEYGDPTGLKPDANDKRFMGTVTASFNDMRDCGWTKVGTATITVTLINEKELISNKVESLQAQLQKERADCEVKCNQILEQISKLSALEYTA